MCTNGEKNTLNQRTEIEIKSPCFFCFVLLFLVLIFITPAVVAKYGVVYPPAVLGHSSVDSRKLGNSTSSPPGHQAVDPALTYEWTPRVPLKQQERRARQG